MWFVLVFHFGMHNRMAYRRSFFSPVFRALLFVGGWLEGANNKRMNETLEQRKN
jgi:hypothetical protein